MNPLYLVDPALIKSVDDVIDLDMQFGIPNTGRMLGFNPSNYIKLIREKISLEDVPEIAKQGFDEALLNLRRFSAKGAFSDAPGMNWDKSSNKALQDGLINYLIAHDKYFNVRHLILELKKLDHRSVYKNANINYFVNELKNLFNYSNELKIIDPYFFDKGERFKILSKLLSNGSLTKKCTSVDIIVSMNKYNSEFNEKTGTSVVNFKRYFNKKHSYTKIRYIIVNDQGKGPLLHERLLLSNLGVLTFDHGMYSHIENEKIECSGLNIYEQAWKKYRNIERVLSGSIVIELN